MATARRLTAATLRRAARSAPPRGWAATEERDPLDLEGERRRAGPALAAGPRARAHPPHRHVRAERARLGLVKPAPPPARRDQVGLQRRRMRPRRRPDHTASTRGRRGGSRSGSASRSAIRPPARAAHDLHDGGDRLDLLHRAAPEEHERHVQRGVGERPPHRGVEPLSRARGERVADGGGQVERDEQARRGRSGHRAHRPPTPSSRRRSRCIATVVERSRTSARPPGSCDAAVDARARRAAPRSSRPSRPACPRSRRPGPATPVTPIPTSAPKRSQRAVGQRSRHLRRHRAHARRSAPGRRPPGRPSPRSE